VRMAKTNQIEEVMEAARKDSQVLAVMLFGSRARGTGSRVSDIDLCLVLSPKSYSPLQMSRKKLEYTSRFSADIQVFQQLPLYIRQRVLRDGKVLYCQDEDALYDIAFSVIREYVHFEYAYRDYLKEVARAR
jgi:uncharacterized protein